MEPILVWGKLLVEVQLVDGQIQFTLTGETRGDRGGKNFGVEFDGATVEKLAELKHLFPSNGLEEHDTGAAANSTSESPNATAGQAVGKRPRISALAGLVRHEKPPGGIERRVHSRYVLEELSKMLLLASGELMAGYVLEISQSGCRIYLDKPYDKKAGEDIEVSFYVHGVPLRLAGKVHAQIDRQIVGVRFTVISPRTRQRFGDLLNEIREDFEHTTTPSLT
jgi:hypothetical protein